MSRDRFDEDPEVLVGAVPEMRDANEVMNETLEREEIEAMRESAPRADGVRISFIREATEEIKEIFVELVKFMFKEEAEKWRESLQMGIMMPLFKKGDKANLDNYRRVVLLVMASQVLARVLVKRLGWWTEHLGLVEVNQSGFWKGRSMADTVDYGENTGGCGRLQEKSGGEGGEGVESGVAEGKAVGSAEGVSESQQAGSLEFAAKVWAEGEMCGNHQRAA